jgi:O-antigen/teichoic acid export membrane protein
MDLEKDESELNQKSSQRTSSIARLLKNAAFNSGAWGINAVVTLLSAPFIVYKLTIEGYGIYALLTSLVGYYNLMDLGIGQGVTKFVAEYKAKGNQDSISQVINGALLIQVVTGMIASLLLIVFAAPILHLLRVSPQFWTDATQGLYASSIGFFFMMIAGTMGAVLMGLQRYDLTSTVGGIINIVLTVLIVGALSLGAGLKEVIYLTAGSGIVMSFVYVILLRRLLPDWRIFINVNWSLLLNLFRFSAYLFISKVSNLFSSYIVQFVVGAFLGPAMVTYYVIPTKLIGAIGSLMSGSAVVLFPFASELGSLRDSARIQKLFLSGSRLYTAVSIPLFLTLYVAARPILTVWLGPAFAEKGWSVLGLLSLASLFGAMTTVPNLITMGLGYSRVVGIYSLFTVVMYAICLPLFTARWGIVGTAWAMLFVALPSVTLISYEAKYIIHLPVRTYLRAVLGFHLIPLLVSLGLGLVIPRFSFTSAVVAGLVPVMFCLSYFGAMAVAGIIPIWEWVGLIKDKIVPKATTS